MHTLLCRILHDASLPKTCVLCGTTKTARQTVLTSSYQESCSRDSSAVASVRSFFVGYISYRGLRAKTSEGNLSFSSMPEFLSIP